MAGQRDTQRQYEQKSVETTKTKLRLIRAPDILEFTDTDTNFKITIPYHDQGVNRQNWSFQKRMRGEKYIYIFFKETNVNKCIIPKIKNSIMNLTDTTKRRNMN